VFSGDVVSTIVKGISIAGLATLLAPVLGAAITAALGLALGGGVLAAGIAGAFKDPIVLGAAKGTLANLKAGLEGFGKYFTAPMENFLRPVPRIREVDEAAAR
jgi:putative effector of murein hydrolase